MLCSPAGVIVSDRQSVSDRHHTRIWVRPLSRVLRSSSWSVVGSARAPVVSAYPWYGLAQEACIRASSAAGPASGTDTGAYRTAKGRATRTATAAAHTAHRQPALIATTYVEVLWGGPAAIDS